jgi:hypothetical protein
VLDDPDEGRRRALRGRALVLRSYEQQHVFDTFTRMLERQYRRERGIEASHSAIAS